MPTVPYGLCHCGCGKNTTVPNKTDRSVGRVAGVPMRFCQGHRLRVHMKGARGSDVPWWKGGKTRMSNGYIAVQVGVGHPMADKHGRVYEHRLVMSKALGRTLTRKEHVHHINGVKDDNRLANLMLFPDTAAHHRHHAELRAKERV